MRIPADILCLLAPTLYRNGVVKRRSSAEQVRWLSVGNLTGTEYKEGFLDTGEWVAETANGLISIEDESAWHLLLPLLKGTSSEITEALRTSLRDLPQVDRIIDAFPLSDVLKYALSHGDYWAGMALKWLDSLGLNQLDEYKAFLELLVKDTKMASQQTRHHAERVLKRLNARH